MSFQSACPSRDQLESIMRGNGSLSEAERIAEHVENCRICQQTLQGISSEDTFSDEVRARAKEGDVPIDSAMKQLIEQVSKRQALYSNDTVGVESKSDSGANAQSLELGFLAPTQAPDEIGRLGQYRVLKVLGKGCMGVVLLGHDPHLDRPVALKVMLPQIAANDSAKQRFLREARAAAKLKSDHIVTIYQVSEERGVPFLAMEFLEGAPLDQFLQNGRTLTTAQILRIAREVARGLADAHERGLIHRDIKPGNIWLDKAHGGRAKILDFGLARAQDDIHVTQSGAILGTPAYMAPEQARGEKVDARADLFSLGCVLYRVCVGDIPFKGETTMGVLMALAMHDPPPPLKINDKIPPALSGLIMQLLDKDAAKRPASARDVVARLQEIEKAIAGLRQDLQQGAASASPSDATQVELSFSPPPMAQVLSEPGLLTALEEAKAMPPASKPARPRRPVVLIVAISLLALLLVGAGGYWALTQLGIIRIASEQGDYVIDTDDPDFAFSVGKGGVILEDRKTKRKYNLKVVGGDKSKGEHELEVTDLDAELSFKVKNFTIRRGEQVALKAWFDRKVVKDDAVPPLPAVVNHEISFEKGGDIALPSLKVDNSKPFTIEAFVTLRNNDKIQVVLESDGHCFLAVGANSFVVNDCLDAGGRTMKAESKQPFEVGKRTHVAGVFSVTHMRLFIDGKLVDTTESKWPMSKRAGENKNPFRACYALVKSGRANWLSMITTEASQCQPARVFANRS